MVDVATLQDKLLHAFPGADIAVEDLTGTQDHYRVRIVSPVFADLALLRRHRLVYQALGTAVGAEIHALTLDLKAPGEH